nr:uncharacterized protein LOC111754153 [Cavia porcellus]
MSPLVQTQVHRFLLHLPLHCHREIHHVPLTLFTAEDKSSGVTEISHSQYFGRNNISQIVTCARRGADVRGEAARGRVSTRARCETGNPRRGAHAAPSPAGAWPSRLETEEPATLRSICARGAGALGWRRSPAARVQVRSLLRRTPRLRGPSPPGSAWRWSWSAPLPRGPLSPPPGRADQERAPRLGVRPEECWRGAGSRACWARPDPGHATGTFPCPPWRLRRGKKSHFLHAARVRAAVGRKWLGRAACALAVRPAVQKRSVSHPSLPSPESRAVILHPAKRIDAELLSQVFRRSLPSFLLLATESHAWRWKDDKFSC